VLMVNYLKDILAIIAVKELVKRTMSRVRRKIIVKAVMMSWFQGVMIVKLQVLARICNVLAVSISVVVV